MMKDTILEIRDATSAAPQLDCTLGSRPPTRLSQNPTYRVGLGLDFSNLTLSRVFEIGFGALVRAPVG